MKCFFEVLIKFSFENMNLSMEEKLENLKPNFFLLFEDHLSTSAEELSSLKCLEGNTQEFLLN